ncbi:MAG: hypothetical protein CVV25_01495 [Ignavibacteriae bacterium HGW-Ignavibacteriae-4]|jgi:uncharacterized protein (DUF302 family)|nr:MAG: hypothetical protein CVV25_01495 [Ignavibacteriae bacterium HGW-Ignavibacteriae-4]
MNYSYSTKLKGEFEDIIERVTAELKTEGFGVLTQIDVTKTLKEKIDVDFKKYRILGACNPHFAHKALSLEEKVGVMLPCNVIVVEAGEGEFEVTAVSPMASMQAIKNENLVAIAQEVEDKLKTVINRLK